MGSIYQWFDKLAPGSGALIFWIIIGLIAVVAIFLLFRKSKSSSTGKSAEKIIRNFCHEVLENVSIRDEVDGPIPVDYLCLTVSGIYVIDIKDYRGLLFGGENTDQWTQVIGNRSYKFDNPLFQNKVRVHAIKTLIDDEIPVQGCVIFSNAGSFPKDKPDGVYMQDKLAEELNINTVDKVPENYHTVWGHLKAALD